MREYNFDLIVSALPEYKNQNTEYIKKAIFGARTILGPSKNGTDGVSILTGQKHDCYLNRIENNIFFQDGSDNCVRSVSGNTTHDQEEVEVKSIKISENLCPKIYWDKWQSQLMISGAMAGSSPTDFPFSDFIYQYKMESIQAEIEKLFWQGDTASGSGNLAYADGLIQFLSGKTTNYQALPSTGTTSLTNVIERVDDLIVNQYAATAHRSDNTLYMSITNFLIFIQALKTANLYHYNPNDEMNLTYRYGNVLVVGTDGLQDVDSMYLFPRVYAYLVTDLIDEMDNMSILVNPFEENRIQFDVRFKFGVGSGDPAVFTHNNSAL
jgi:hypothetical protein